MPKWTQSLVAVFLWGLLVGWALPAAAEAPKPPAAKPREVAISLRVMQKKLQSYGPQKPVPREFLHLFGMTRLTTYVVDPAHRDVILKGDCDPSLPPLHLDDLVAALRNIFEKYVVVKDNIRYYSFPGCSIDPTPQGLQELQQFLSVDLNAIEDFGEYNQNFRKLCQKPQTVRVEGLPFDSRFAWVMVKADYDMKRLVNSEEGLKVPGFTSLAEIRKQAKLEQLQKGLPLSGRAFFNRFWFYPGAQEYLEDQGVMRLQRCTVKLLTEEEHLGQAGERKGTGQPEPLAKQFAEAFSEHYHDIARQRPIYTELENLFRFVALLQMMKEKKALRSAKLELSYLLDGYPLKAAPLERQLPGVPAITQVKRRQTVEGGQRVSVYWAWMCGGVDMRLKPTPDDIIQDATGKLAAERSQILRSRPTPETLYWEVTFN